MLLHWLLQIWQMSVDGKTSMISVVKKNVVPMLWRSFADGLIFAGIWQHPQMIADVAKFFGHPISADEASVFAWPMNNVLAGAYGMGIDYLISHIPGLKNAYPSLVVVTEVKQTVQTVSTVESKTSLGGQKT